MRLQTNRGYNKVLFKNLKNCLKRKNIKTDALQRSFFYGKKIACHRLKQSFSIQTPKKSRLRNANAQVHPAAVFSYAEFLGVLFFERCFSSPSCLLAPEETHRKNHSLDILWISSLKWNFLKYLECY